MALCHRGVRSIQGPTERSKQERDSDVRAPPTLKCQCACVSACAWRINHIKLWNSVEPIHPSHYATFYRQFILHWPNWLGKKIIAHVTPGALSLSLSVPLSLIILALKWLSPAVSLSLSLFHLSLGLCLLAVYLSVFWSLCSVLFLGLAVPLGLRHWCILWDFVSICYNNNKNEASIFSGVI